MSNSSKSNEIDEVMSSVRKLVSRIDGPTNQVQPAAADSDAGKLVLSPDFRVKDGDRFQISDVGSLAASGDDEDEIDLSSTMPDDVATSDNVLQLGL